MHVKPSISVDTSDLTAASKSRDEPWNPVDACANGRRVALPDTLSPPPIQQGTSQVGDLGDHKYLGQPKLSPRQSLTPVANDTFDQLGAGFSAPSDAKALEICDTRSTGGESISLGSSDLSALIREKSQEAVSAERRTFYAISDLEDVVTRTTARQTLANIPDVEEILDQIFNPRTVSDHKTRVFRIFVILTLIGKPEAIKDFIDDEIYDLDLPFEKTTAEGTWKNKDQYLRNRQIPGRRQQEVGIFKRWSAFDIDSFMDRQHAVCIPIFDLDTQGGAPVSHYNLHGQTILPYIENDEHGMRGEGRSDVWKVRIHPAHTIYGALGTDMSLAVKKLTYRGGNASPEVSEKLFNKEANNLRRFASRNHDFIIKLLCTFQWRNDYYFLFPWADGNLYDFWSRHPTPLARLKQPSTARWLSTQFLGLATALRDIHRGDSHPSLHLTPQQKNHGKHGDIKPENILYFKTDFEEHDLTNGACLVQLKISDLGEAEFHSTTSMRVDAMDVRHTPSYSAPELRVKKISMPTYDVFSLACVLLEFVTWYLQGYRGVEKFREQRLKEHEAPVYNFDVGKYKVDGFFKHVDVLMDEARHRGAMHKSSVSQEIVRLCEDEYCSDYILDLLVFIKDQLLRMNPKNRADCDTIYKKFQEFDEQCRRDETYCVDKLQKAPARSRTDRSLITDIEIEFPDEQQFELIGPKSGGGGEYQIKLVRKVDNLKTTLQRQLSSIEEGQRSQDVNEDQDRAVTQNSSGQAEHPVEDLTPPQDIPLHVNPNSPLKASDGARHVDRLDIPGGRISVSPGGSTHLGEDLSNSEHGGRSSSIKGPFMRMKSENDGGDHGSQGVKAKAVRFLRAAFCFTK